MTDKKQTGEVITPKYRVSLPVPDSEVVGMTNDDPVRMRYIESIEKIAGLEAKTLIELQQIQSSFRFKIALIIAGLSVLAAGTFFGLKIEGKKGDASLSIQPKQTNK